MDQTKNDSGQSGNKSETPPKVIYTPDKIISALMYIEDVMGRALIPFILGGLLAECLYSDAPVEANGVDLILRPKHLTPEARNTLAVYLGGDKDDYVRGFELEHLQVPIRVKVVTMDYDFLKYADFRFLAASEYLIPNPFEKYWDVRETIE